MSLLTVKPKKFTITYDGGKGQVQTLDVRQSQFEADDLFQKYILEMKCLSCGLITKFADLKKDHSDIESSDLIVNNFRKSLEGI